MGMSVYYFVLRMSRVISEKIFLSTITRNASPPLKIFPEPEATITRHSQQQSDVYENWLLFLLASVFYRDEIDP